MKARQTRHSKVYTPKGPRDRRVRLSAMTAIQFYDVQDRLGYDRPSEAVDWLILKAKASIEALPHKPNAVTPYSADGQNPMQDLPSSVKHARESFGQEKLRNLQASVSFPVENLGLVSTDHIHIPEFSFDMGNHAVDPFPVVGSQDCDLVPSSCLDQVVFSSSLFSKKTSPMQKSVFSSAPLASSMEEAPRKRRVLNWPFVTPPSIELQSSFQIGE